MSSLPQDTKQKVYLRTFKGLREFCQENDKIVNECLATNSQYAKYIRDIERGQNECLRTGKGWDADTIEKDFGNPLPTSVQDALSRTVFLNQKLYSDTFEEMKPLLDKLEKMSQGIVPKEVIKPTDRDLGIFSFDRAMMGMEKVPAFYSEKYKKFYLFSQVDTKTGEKGEKIYTLKNDGSDVTIKQLEIDGVPQYASTNKKSFLYKEKFPRPKSAIHIYSYFNVNVGKVTFWAGLASAIIAYFMETKGYSVRVTAVSGGRVRGIKGTPDDGYRIDLFDIKGYDEVIDSGTLLLPIADSSFFRMRVFRYIMANQWKNGDAYDGSLGQSLNPPGYPRQLQDIIEGQQKLKNLETEQDTLTYYIGGDATYELEMAVDNIKRVICNAENENRAVLQKLGIDMTEADIQDLSDPALNIDCSKYTT